MLYRLGLVMCLGLAGLLAGCSSGRLVDDPAFVEEWEQLGIGKQMPLRQLPAHVPAPDSKISLYADFSSRRNGHLDLYLINRAASYLSVDTEEGDPFCKLEAKAGGRWQRAQTHVYGWCGMSYYAVTIKRGHFVKFRGYAPDKGPRRKARYRFYSKDGLSLHKEDPIYSDDEDGEKAKKVSSRIVSNAGVLRVPNALLYRAGRDAMAVRFGDFALVAGIATGRVATQESTDGNYTSDARWDAIRRLEEFPPEQSKPVLHGMLKDKSLSQAYLRPTLLSLHSLAPKEAQQFFLDVTADRKHPWRNTLIKESYWEFGGSKNALVRKRIEAICSDPEDPGFLFALERGPWPDNEAFRRKMQKIIEDDSLPAARHARMREAYFNNVPNSVFSIDIDTPGRKPNSWTPRFVRGKPIRIELVIENDSIEPIRFSYRHPSELVVIRHAGRYEDKEPPRAKRLEPSVKPGQKPTEINIAAKGKHRIAMDLAELYDFSSGYHILVFRGRIRSLHYSATNEWYYHLIVDSADTDIDRNKPKP